MELPLSADVYCTDGTYGRLIGLVSRDDEPLITHLVVASESQPEQRRLVPLEHVAGADASKVQLNVSRDQMITMTTATQTTDIYEPMPEPALDPTLIRTFEHVDHPHIQYAEQELLPPGTVTIDDKTDVSARGGAVGKLSSLLLNDGTGAIEALTVHESGLLGGKSITFPASAIDHVNGPTILLAMSKDEITA
ncbi:MAG: hypothetical protein H7Y32_17055 [Chloroflexales bacterium]|nr:hypothetical protein [Chloroflexales bacterium]